MFRRIAIVCTLLLVAPAPGEARAQQRGQFDRVPLNPADEAYVLTPPGFSRPGEAAVASGSDVGQLRVVIRDADTGERTPCRVNVVGPDGDFYYPPDDRLAPFRLTGAWPEGQGNRPTKAPIRYFGRFFYTLGEFTVDVPAGAVRVETWKGFEYRPQSVGTEVVAGERQSVEIDLHRGADMHESGYYSGDAHLHFDRRDDADDRLIFDLMEAEDIRYGNILCYNENTAAYFGAMDRQVAPQRRGLGSRSARRRGSYHMISAQEYRATHYGHINLFLRDSIVLENNQLDPNTWPVFGLIGEETRQLGGYLIHAHGGYAQEIYADFALGATDGVELLQFGIYRGIGLQGWYRMLNAGYRFPAIGASDYPACRKLGDCRTYVYAPEEPSSEEWIRRMAAGYSFVSSGPLLLLTVEGRPPGSILEMNDTGPHRVRARVRVRCEVAPVERLSLVVNGETVRHVDVPRNEGQDAWLELNETIELADSSWIAARAFSRAPSGSPDADSHTNPVYVYIDGRAPYRAAAVDWLIDQLDGQIEALNEREFAERSRSLAYFAEARAELARIRSAGGRAAPAAPTPP